MNPKKEAESEHVPRITPNIFLIVFARTVRSKTKIYLTNVSVVQRETIHRKIAVELVGRLRRWK